MFPRELCFKIYPVSLRYIEVKNLLLLFFFSMVRKNKTFPTLPTTDGSLMEYGIGSLRFCLHSWVSLMYSQMCNSCKLSPEVSGIFLAGRRNIPFAFVFFVSF